MIIATKSFKLSKTGIHAVIKGTLKVGDLLTKDFGDGKKLWKVVEILNGVATWTNPTFGTKPSLGRLGGNVAH